MEKMWAPWRKKYLMSLAKEEEGCIFCNMPAMGESHDPENHIIHRGESNFIILNLYPYNNNHLMIVPYRHLANFEDLTTDETAEMCDLLQILLRTFKKMLNPDGFNAGLNLGRTAGAGIHEHLHLHLVPRWSGDTNFMPVLAGTKVISESLDESYRHLKKAFDQEINGKN